MNKHIIYKNYIPKKYINIKLNKKISKKYSIIYKNINKNIDHVEDNFHSLSKKFKINFNFKDLVKFKKFNTIAVIGMGGSILGAEAIYYALEKKIKKNFIFFNNINEIQLHEFKKKQKIDKILFIIISKSGNTIETLSNVLMLKIIKRNKKNLIIISEKSDNPLYLLSKKMNLFYIEHKSYIGGRYSVLSEVGMIPAYLMGLNILNFRRNLLIHFKKKNNKFLRESTIKLSNLLKNKKLNNLIFVNYFPQLNQFLFWCQQLIAESLGKKNLGFLPVISTAPKDHHSLLQLYLDGPKDKLFHIFSHEKNELNKISVKFFDKKFNFLSNKSLNKIKTAQKDAFIEELKKKNIPYREFKIRDLNEKILGELFSYFILETAIVGELCNINPFDQPAVEQVKINTKKNLS